MELPELTNLLAPMTPIWKTLAINLGIPLWISDGIDNKLRPDECFRKVLNTWITNSDDDNEPTFEALYRALNSHAVANRPLAIRLLRDIEVLELLTVSNKAQGFACTP